MAPLIPFIPCLHSFFEEQKRLKEQVVGNEPSSPFFLYVALSHMHVPLAYDPQFENASTNKDRQIYGNALAEVDHEIGRIVLSLRQTGLANDTLFWITSDNGVWDVSRLPIPILTQK